MKNEFDYLNDVSIDFSVYENAELSEKEKKEMKRLIKRSGKKINKKTVFGIAAAAAVITAISVTGFAGDMMFRIVKKVSTGHNSFVQTDSSNSEIRLPKELRGLLFDENGKEAKTFKNGSVYYDKDGNEITDYGKFVSENLPEKGELTMVDENGKDVKVAYHKPGDEAENPLERHKKDGYNIIYDEAKINDWLDFEAKLPEYLPDGYSFMGAAASDDVRYYLFAYYINEQTGEYFMLDERLLNEETAFEAGTDGTIEEISINGHPAVIMDNRSVDFEIGDVSVGVSGRGVLTRDELIKISESIK